MIYLYAITDRPERPIPAEPGLEGAPLINLVCRDIAAVASHLTMVKVPPAEANLWRHEAVVEALMVDRTVLPARFGTVLTDEAAIQGTLAVHYAEFEADLKRVCGRVELGLRVLWDDNDNQPLDANHKKRLNGQRPAISGRAYLLSRLEEERQAQAQRQRAKALAKKLHTLLTQLATQSTWQVLVTPRLLLTAAYLVERERVTSFQRKVEALSTIFPELHFLCTGPWPPYSFVTAGIAMIPSEDMENARSQP